MKKFKFLILIFMSIFFIDNIMAYSSMVTDKVSSNVLGYWNNNGIRIGIWSLKTTEIDGVTNPKHLFCLDPGLEMISNANYTASGSFTNTSYACGIIDAYNWKNGLNFNNLSTEDYAEVQRKIWSNANTGTCERIETGEENLSTGTISIDVSNTELSLSDDGNYFVSGEISVRTSGLLGLYSVNLSGAPSGAGVYTSPDSTISVSETESEALYIKVPVSSVNSSSSFTLTLSGEYNKTKHTYLNATLSVFNYSSGGTFNRVDISEQRLALVDTYETYSYDVGTVDARKDFSIKKVTLTIIKTNSSGDPIIGKTAKFGIYSDSNCETKVTDLNIYADKGGIGTVSISPGTYYYKELKQPDRYEIDDTCRRITINKDEEIRVKNTMTCDSELDYILNKYNDKRLTETEKRTELIDIYLKYNKDGDYTNLLNFDNPTCSKNTQCSPNRNEVGCLTVKTKYDVVGKENNLSCFNDKIQITTNNNSKATAFCFENFNLWNTLSSANNYEYIQSYNFNGNYFKSGQMILNRTNSLIAQGKVYKMCYVYGIGINDIIEKDPIVDEKKSYSDYVGDLKFNGTDLGGTSGYEEFNCSGTGNKTYNNGEWCVKTFTAAGHNDVSYLYLQKYYYKNYDLNKVYVNNGTGREPVSYPCTECKFLGYGFISKLYNGNNSENCSYIDSTRKELGLNCIVPWSIKFTLKDQETDFTSETCTYNIKDEIVDCIGDNCSGNTPKLELQLEFRIIDTDNPFPGKSGQGRTPGSNWRLNNNIEDFDVNKDGDVTLKDILILRKIIAGSVSLPETISNIEKYDINKNGKVDIKDALLIKEITREETAGISDRLLMESVMDLTNNSYNKNGTGPKYTITLTSDTIKEIRNYNRTNSYDDYNLTCDENGYNCESTFLKDLKEGIVNGNPVSSILVDIEEETGKFNWNPESCGECRIGNSISIFD